MEIELWSMLSETRLYGEDENLFIWHNFFLFLLLYSFKRYQECLVYNLQLRHSGIMESGLTWTVGVE